MAQQPQDFESAKTRLEEIAAAVGDESMPLDEALDLFEEAVTLGLKVSDYIESGIVIDEDAVLAEDGKDQEPAAEAGAAPAAEAGAAVAEEPSDETRASDDEVETEVAPVPASE